MHGSREYKAIIHSLASASESIKQSCPALRKIHLQRQMTQSTRQDLLEIQTGLQCRVESLKKQVRDAETRCKGSNNKLIAVKNQSLRASDDISDFRSRLFILKGYKSESETLQNLLKEYSNLMRDMLANNTTPQQLCGFLHPQLPVLNTCNN